MKNVSRGRRVELVYGPTFEDLRRKLYEIQRKIEKNGGKIVSVVVRDIKTREEKFTGEPEITLIKYDYWAVVLYEVEGR